jgi:hypothetical protein
MFQFSHDFEDYFRGSRPVEPTRDLNPRLQGFKEWAEANRDRLQVDSA